MTPHTLKKREINPNEHFFFSNNIKKSEETYDDFALKENTLNNFSDTKITRNL